jgi:hypothetical protein
VYVSGLKHLHILAATLLTLQENISHYKGDTNYQLAPPFLQLPNGTPVTLGYDQVAVPSCNDGNPPILNSGTNPPTVNPTCVGYEQFTRYAPTRTLFPTEEFRFQSSDIKNVQVNGRIHYTGASMKMPQFNENFYGLDNFGIRHWDITGYSTAERVSVTGDLGIVWQLSPRVSLAEQFDFWNFRQPADNYLSEIDQLDDVNPNTPSMLDPPGAAQPAAITAAHNFLGQKTETNTTTLGWKASSWASFSLGYRYRSRTIGYAMPLVTDFLANVTAYTLPIHENAGILGAVLHPSSQWKIDGTFEAAFDDNAYFQLDPRQSYRYQVHSMWTPTGTVTITGAFDDLERRDNQALVNHVDHNRSAGLGAEISPNEHYGFDLNYGYMDAYTRTGLCYSSTAAPADAPTAPADCGTNTYLGTGYYDEPTQSASIDIMLSPNKHVTSHAGYRINAVNGTTEFLNPLAVPGSLQSHYQTPFFNVKWAVAAGWGFCGEWNLYDYSEGGRLGRLHHEPSKPTSARLVCITISKRAKRPKPIPRSNPPRDRSFLPNRLGQTENAECFLVILQLFRRTKLFSYPSRQSYRLTGKNRMLLKPAVTLWATDKGELCPQTTGMEACASVLQR